MAKFNAMTEKFLSVTVLGKPAIYTDIRIDRSTLPPGLHYYEIRHDDDGQGDFAQIAKGILVNHMGSVIMRDKLKLPSDGYLDIDDNDINFTDENCRTVKDYIDKYPRKKKNYER